MIRMKRATLLVLVLILVLSLTGCNNKHMSYFTEDEPNTQNQEIESYNDEKLKLSKTTAISQEGTVFSYDGNDYEITEREKLVYSIRGYERIGKHILVVGNMGKNAAYYGIFNAETQEFETDIIASQITYWDDDIYSLVYCIDNKIYDYCGNAIGGYELSDSEYIYDIYLENEGKELVIEIGSLKSDEKPRIVNVIYKNAQCNGK